MKLRLLGEPRVEGCIDSIVCEVGLVDDQYRLYQQGTIELQTVIQRMRMVKTELNKAIYDRTIELVLNKIEMHDCECTIEVKCDISCVPFCAWQYLTFVFPRRQSVWADKLYRYLQIKAKEEPRQQKRA
jgi:hypothetical protein